MESTCGGLRYIDQNLSRCRKVDLKPDGFLNVDWKSDETKKIQFKI